jgi:hypothetical protein
MAQSGFYILSFASTHHAIAAEGSLKGRGINVEIVPTPRDITASCGLSIRFDVGQLEQVKKEIGKIWPDIRLHRGIYAGNKPVYFEEEISE